MYMAVYSLCRNEQKEGGGGRGDVSAALCFPGYYAEPGLARKAAWSEAGAHVVVRLQCCEHLSMSILAD